MADEKVVILGEKESFLIRVLIGKLQEAEVAAGYIHWDVNGIHDAWEETQLIAMYMNDDEKPGEDVLHYLMEKLGAAGSGLLLVGGENELRYVQERVPAELIYKSFTRPLDNAEFIRYVLELQEKMEAGELRKSILVVDDDPSYLGLVRQWLKDRYRVALVSSGMQALRWLGKNKADLILLDHEMPVTSGPQVLEMLRSDEETRHIPVMFLTGKGDKQSVMAVLSLKPEGYLLKSVGKEELLTKLQEFFLRQQ